MWSTGLMAQRYCQGRSNPIFRAHRSDVATAGQSHRPNLFEREANMKKTIALAAVLAASMALSACGKKAADETAGAANAMMSDANATMGEAMNTVDAATDNAMGAVANTADAAGNTMGSAADKMKAATGDAMSTAGNTMEAAGDAMKK
jgi:hypothetical protein